MKIHPARLPHKLAPSGSGSELHHASSHPSALRPNPSLKLIRYGRHCKPGLSHSYYRLSPGLQYLPTRAA